MIDDRSQATIATLLPEVQPRAVALIEAMNTASFQVTSLKGLTIKAISGTRTYADQNALYAQGRTIPGHIVTNAPAGYSLHNFGIALDIGIFNEAGQYIDDVLRNTDSIYRAFGPIGRSQGFEWGGDWTSIKDYPHYQWNPLGLSTAQLRARVADGQSLIA